MRSEPQDMALAVDVQPLNCRVWLDSFTLCLKQMLLNELNQAKSA